MRITKRLDKILSNSGYGTRKELKQILKRGIVKVDNKVVKDGSVHVDPVQSVIEIDGEILDYREFVYLMLNKPEGVISATFDNRHRTVVDILPDEYAHFELFPVGRLDIDTEGLLIMTNDGQLAHELLSPKKHVKKRYYALIDGAVTDDDVKAFKEGVVLDDGYKTMSSDLFVIKSGQNSEIEVDICEGKFHQVKRMFNAVGKEVKYLRRIKMGGLMLDENLEPGQCRELTDEEINLLSQPQEINPHKE
jgi:16S rRNA pseudouridine516 synthase